MRRFGVILVLTTIGVAASAQGVSDSGTAVAIRSLEKQWTVGQARNDTRALDLIFDESLLYVEYGSLISKAAYFARIKTQAPGTDQITMEPMSVSIFGNTGIVVGSYAERQISGRSHSVKRWRFVDTWVYKKNGWVLVAAGAAPATE